MSMLFLLGALAVGPAAAARGGEALDARRPADTKGRLSAAAGVLVAGSDDTYLCQPISLHQVAMVGAASRRPASGGCPRATSSSCRPRWRRC